MISIDANVRYFWQKEKTMAIRHIVVFGATGGTGLALTEQALQRNYQVTAFVRDPARLPVQHDRLRIVQGDVLKPDTLAAALQGQDAVLCALGRKPFVNEPVCSAGTNHVLQEMARQGVRRIVVETAIGVGESINQCGTLQKFLFRTLLRSYFADKALQEQYVQESAADWTIVRPVGLTNGPATTSARASLDAAFTGFAMPSVSRKDVARLMLDQLETTSFRHQAPVLY